MTKVFSKILLISILLSIFSSAIQAESAQLPDESKKTQLKWKDGKINIAFSVSLEKFAPNIKLESDVIGAVRRSLSVWEKVAKVEFVETFNEKNSVSPTGNSGDGVNLITIAPSNENLLLFGDDATEVSAKTRIFYNQKGFITEADIALNPFVQFSTDGTFGTFDIEATLTHEIGHLLGLEHTNFCSSTMHTHQARNGIYNLPQISARTLSDADISSIRALYGAPESLKNCCGTVKGKLSLPANVSASGFQVWLEEFATGKIQAGTTTALDGSFVLEGLNAGKYRLYAQDSGLKQKNRKKIVSGNMLGEVTVEDGKIVIFDKEISLRSRTIALKYVGFNGQLSNVSVPVNGGKIFQIYLGGENLNPNDYKISAESPFIKIKSDSVVLQDFGNGVSVLRLEILTHKSLPNGDYTITVEKNNGEKFYLVGALTSDFFQNPWSISTSEFTE